MSDSASITSQLAHVAALAQIETRSDAADALAREVGAENLLIFVRDEAVGISLPALGFPQTLQGSRVWRDLIDQAVATGSAEGSVTVFPGGTQRQAWAIGLRDGTAAVLLGGTPRRDGLEILRALLPLLGALFCRESGSLRAQAESILARQSAAHAGELASKLDATRADLQRAVAVAETATRARDEFLASVSHELRTPLTSIVGWIQLLRGHSEPAQIAEGLETIERNARAQSRLIEDILDFSRINAGKLRLDVQPIELIDIVGAALDVIRPAADAKGVSLDSVLDPGSGLVSGDPDRLQQVVWNLLSNSVKFTPRGGRVQIRLERVTSHCELTVSDTGEGISPQFLPFVFDRFSQADSTSTRSHGGLGLGLGIVRHLVELHGGTVQAFSPGIGQGSTFVVRLPLIVARTQALVSPPAEGAAPVIGEVAGPSPEDLADLTGVSILVVEDNDDARKLLTTIFSRCGAAVESAANVSIAFRLLGRKRPDIIISDIEMPGEDGYTFMEKIRSGEPRVSRIPAIALTAYTRTVDRVRALAAGFQMHMGKPVEPAELVAAVKSLLSTSGAKQPMRGKRVE